MEKNKETKKKKKNDDRNGNRSVDIESVLFDVIFVVCIFRKAINCTMLQCWNNADAFRQCI